MTPSSKNTGIDPPPKRQPRKIVDGSLLVLTGFTLAGVVAVVLTSGAGRALEILVETLCFLALLAPKIVAGLFIAAVLPMILPRDKVGRMIGGDSGVKGLATAVLCGAALPGGPMMTFPIAAGLAGAGADLGAVVAFISGWSLLGLNRTLIWEFSFLPSDLVWLRYVVSLPMPLLLGMAVRIALRERGA